MEGGYGGGRIGTEGTYGGIIDVDKGMWKGLVCIHNYKGD